MPSNTQTDRLGERLKRSVRITDDDLREREALRSTFTAAYSQVVGELRSTLGTAPTGRPAKSTKAIVDKLRRKSVRLSQMQDVAGCRIIV